MFEARKVVNVSGRDWLSRVFYPANVNFHQYPLRVIDAFMKSDQKVWQTVYHVLNALKNLRESVEWSEKVHIIGYGYPDDILTNNTNMIFALEKTRAEHLVRIQHQLNMQGCRILPEIYFQKSPASYNLCDDYPFIDRLNGILHRIHSAGLHQKWFDDDLRDWLGMVLSLKRVVVPDIEYRNGVVHRLKNLRESVEWSEKVHIIGYGYNDEILTNNTNMIFSLEKTRAKHLVRIQHQLNMQGCRILPEIYLQKSPASYNLCDDYPFIDRLNGILHRIHSAGLHQKWFDDDLQDWVGRVLSLKRGAASDDAEIDTSTIPLGSTIIYGWICAFVVFVLEILWKKKKVFNKVANPHGTVEPLGLICPYER
ncbi:hypothetical protein HA402_004028 [Bradysia odoriphaga]|nr:hypothetical protein HA402_004028 [Bradysia odoriphaga]